MTDAKGWLSERMEGSRSYSPTSDQAPLTALFDLAMARSRSRSLDKLCRDLSRHHA